MKSVAIKLIEIYQTYFSFDRGLFSVFAPGGACKHSPTCSEYTRQMIVKYGLIKGLTLGGRKFFSCR